MPYVCRNKPVYFHGEDKGTIQDYLVLTKKYSANDLFEDDQFPATGSSLSKTNPDTSYTWLRPFEIEMNAKFIVDGPSRFDINQGQLGDCWMLAGMANLPLNLRMWSFVVPNKQTFKKDYAGVFHFRLWRHGRWVDVVIDDRLPTEHGKLVYLTSTVGNEFWSALLEKAYAKMHGSYEAIIGGVTLESMVDFSGGVPEIFQLKAEDPKALFPIIHKAYLQKAWITCSIFGTEGKEYWESDHGLVPGHAYTVTAARRVKLANKEKKQRLIRVRNPWGQSTEWTGTYKDNSKEWQSVSEEDRNKLNLEFKNDGEYWMDFNDFLEYFCLLEICHLSKDSFKDMPGEFGNYLVTEYHGSWSIKDGTAGGNKTNEKTFKNNHQYRITLHEHDECDFDDDLDDEDDHKPDCKCTLIVSLMQKNRRKCKTEYATGHHSIGCYVYHIQNPEKWPNEKLENRFLYSNEPVFSPQEFLPLREVSKRISVKPGTYLIIPCTGEKDLEAEFMVRILTEKHADCCFIE